MIKPEDPDYTYHGKVHPENDWCATIGCVSATPEAPAPYCIYCRSNEHWGRDCHILKDFYAGVAAGEPGVIGHAYGVEIESEENCTSTAGEPAPPTVSKDMTEDDAVRLVGKREEKSAPVLDDSLSTRQLLGRIAVELHRVPCEGYAGWREAVAALDKLRASVKASLSGSATTQRDENEK
jgi:hypothetical protein